MQIFVNPDYKFVKHRWKGVAVSAVFVLAGIVAYFIWGVNWGIDFAGGAAITLKFKDAPPIAQLRGRFPDATIQQYGTPDNRALLIRLPEQKRETDYAGQITESLHRDMNPEAASKLDLNYYGADRLSGLFKQLDPDNRGTNPAAVAYYDQLARKVIEKRSSIGIFKTLQDATSTAGITANDARVLNEKTFAGAFNILNQETVGPQVGSELQRKALIAIILSSLAMGLYIWFRFADLTFGLGAVACIIHDVAIALSFMLFMRLEFSLNIVAALLMIVGYSINDTVVMYDRVRENKRKIKKPMPLAEHLDLAINQTLSRTILTSGSVFLVLVALIAFGGDVIRGFAWILLMGVISGTYSTLLIVPAVAVGLDRWTSKRAAAAPVRPEPTRIEPAARKRKAS
ncbi:MAG: protein translocase subunit SecF [Acidobacteria bacterium]|nr:protein translocase subunit SecF [Acidobacteriota bacterium]MBV9477345.1 protein translocase subunit SecF [Acidobacteriota bacterium]